MPSQISPQQYGQAVLEHVQNGSYPESEEIVAAEIPPSALPQISHLIEQAKEDVKVSRLLNSSSSTRLRMRRQKSGSPAKTVLQMSMGGSPRPSSYASIFRSLKR